MAVPTAITDLSATIASNVPAGSDQAFPYLDDYLRAAYGFIRQGDTKASDVASATTTNIGAAVGRIVDVTGTTTITSFGTAAAGVWRILRFTGALTVMHNASSLILPGGEHYTTTAGDVMLAVSLGSGNWYAVYFPHPEDFTQSGTGAVARGTSDKLTDIVSVKDFGATGDGSTDDTVAIQAAMDVGGRIYVPAGTYIVSSSLLFKSSGICLVGDGRNNTTISFTGTTGPVFKSSAPTTATRLWCGLSRMKIAATGLTTTLTVVDLKSFQFGVWDELWITGPDSNGSVGINFETNWTVTEATYNIVRDCYIGLVYTGVRFYDGANSNQVIGGRIQVGVSNGNAIVLAGSAAERCSNNTILAVGMEYPGNVSNGVNVGANTNGTTVLGCRFEALATGILIDSGASNVYAPLLGNYFSDCTTDITALSRTVATTVIAAASFNGTSAAVTGTARGCTVSRTGIGAYTVTFDRAMSNAEYSVSISSSGSLKAISSKSAASFSFVTQNVSQVAEDHSVIDVTVVGVA